RSAKDRNYLIGWRCVPRQEQMKHHALASISGRKRDRLPAPIRGGIVNLLHLRVERSLIVGLKLGEYPVGGIVDGLADGLAEIDIARRAGERFLGGGRDRAPDASKTDGPLPRPSLFRGVSPESVRLFIPGRTQDIMRAPRIGGKGPFAQVARHV